MQEKELEILEYLYQDTSLHQRDLSRIVGLSLGMTNAILKRLAVKGFLMVRKVNNRNIKYIVSPAGLEEISKRSYNYFKRTIKNIVYYKENLERSLRRLKEAGIERVLLEGESDVDFIIEHLCSKIGLQFSRTDDGYHPEKNELVLVSENESPVSPEKRLSKTFPHTPIQTDSEPPGEAAAGTDAGVPDPFPEKTPVPIVTPMQGRTPGPGVSGDASNSLTDVTHMPDIRVEGCGPAPDGTPMPMATEEGAARIGNRLYLRSLLIRT